MKLYVDVERKKGERITTFLKKCYNLQNKYNISFTETYFDELCQNKQCKKANRSFEDLYATIKTYYPDCSKEHFAKQLEKILNKSKIRLIFCPDIQKWVFMNVYFGSLNSNYKYLYDFNSSRLKTNNKGKGEYTYFDILSLMGYIKKQCKI